MVRLKVCCIASVKEAETALAAGASALGLVTEMPSGPGVIDDETARDIAVRMPPGIATFLLTSRTDADDVVDHIRMCGTNTVQLVDAVDAQVYSAIRRALPNVKIVQVIHVQDETAQGEAQACAPHVDAILLDSGNPNLTVKVLGGTGRTHNWEISRDIVEAVQRPVFLAGGLTPGNVAGAIDKVRPFGVDVCSGLRTDGRLDRHKLEQFCRAMQAP